MSNKGDNGIKSMEVLQKSLRYGGACAKISYSNSGTMENKVIVYNAVQSMKGENNQNEGGP